MLFVQRVSYHHQHQHQPQHHLTAWMYCAMGFYAIALFHSAALLASLSLFSFGFAFWWHSIFTGSPFSRPLSLFDILSKLNDFMQPKNGAGGLNGDIFQIFAQNKHFMVIFIGILTLDSVCMHNIHTNRVLICSCSKPNRTAMCERCAKYMIVRSL